MFDLKQQNYHKKIPSDRSGPTFLFFSLNYFERFLNSPKKKKWHALCTKAYTHKWMEKKSQILNSLKLLRHDDMSWRLQIKHRDKINWVLEKKPKRKDLTKTLKSHNFNPYLAHDNQYSLRNCRKAESSFMSIQPSYFSQV